MNSKFEISQELINMILEYLSSRPYHEVFALINKITDGVKPISSKK